MSAPSASSGPAPRATRAARRRETVRARWASVPEVARTMDALPWLRSLVSRTSFLSTRMPLPGDELAAALADMPAEDRDRLTVAMSGARAHYSTMVEFFGIVGIPSFIAIIAVGSFQDFDDWLVLLIPCALMFYMGMYAYFRMCLALATTCWETMQMVFARPVGFTHAGCPGDETLEQCQTSPTPR